MSNAIPVSAKLWIFNEPYAVQSISLSKGVGEFARASIEFQPNIQGAHALGQNDIDRIVRDLNIKIFSKEELEADVVLSVNDGNTETEFVGIANGCRGVVSASGNASFTIQATEVNRVLTGMNLNAYPSFEGQQEAISRATGSETFSPFVLAAGAEGSIGERIKKLYETAKKNHNGDDITSPHVKAVFEEMRQQNLRGEDFFLNVLEQSNTNPEWLENLNESGSLKLNNMLSRVLFTKQLNLWNALLQIANMCGLVYVGDWGPGGGRFRELDFVSETGTSLSSAVGVQSQTYVYGKPDIQAVGQVIGVGPFDTAVYEPFISRASNNQSNLRTYGIFPETPTPKSGKIERMLLPTFLQPSVSNNEEPDSASSDLLNSGQSASDAEKVAESTRAPFNGVNAEVDGLLNAVTSWCAQQYRILNSVGAVTKVTTPFVDLSVEPGSVAVIGEVNGILRNVSHNLTITANGGNATSNWTLGWVRGDNL